MGNATLVKVAVGLAGLVVLGLAILFLAPQSPGTGADEAVCTSTETGVAPSGRTISLCEIIHEAQPSGASWAVVRVLDPALSDDALGQDHADHDWACETWGLTVLEAEPRPERIVVQVMAAPFVRGEPAQGITQSIEAYSVENGTCIWELL